MLAPSIKSRPIYGVLAPQSGSMHILVADDEGALAILGLAENSAPTFFACAQIIYVASAAAPNDYVARLRALGASAFHEGPSIAAALPRLAQALSTAHMGTRLYLAGTEGLVGQAMRVAIDAGIDPASIVTEHRGSLNRRVQCVHCKGITENVTRQPVACSHCGLTLLVRDHYSQRIAAFQGVCIDAEEPGVVPPAQEIFR
jgi:hypothetical protein